LPARCSPADERDASPVDLRAYTLQRAAYAPISWWSTLGSSRCEKNALANQLANAIRAR
jgi:hypothetical protein